MTGFPGFLGSALLPRLLQQEGNDRAVCIVQEHFQAAAQQRLDALTRANPELAGRVRLLAGDITESGLGLDPAELGDVTSVWHLAAVYDLAVGEDLARRVNIEGTRNVVELCRGLPSLARLHYVSTCYVSGRHPGTFREDDLELGQPFQNFYESTKYEAERLVRRAIDEGLPATIYRPGIVVGDATTGETQKYDGPYFIAHLLKLQPRVAVIPRVADPDQFTMSIVPRDYVLDAMVALAPLPKSVGRTYALTDPHAPTIRELVETFADLLGKSLVWLPVPLAVGRKVVEVQGVERLIGVPAESLDYMAFPTRYDTGNAVADLEGTGVSCPRFADYAPNLIRFFLANPKISSAAMV